MKSLFILFIAILFISCEKEPTVDEDCHCYKFTYHIDEEILTDENGNTATYIWNTLMGRVKVGCEVDKTTVHIDNENYYVIECF